MPTQNIPNGWKKVKLGEVVDLMQGFAVNKKTNHYISDKGLPLLKISDLINNTETLFVREDIPQKFIVNENDIIFSRTGQVGLVFTGKKGVIYNNCFKVIPKGIDKNYLYYWLKSSYVKYMANTLATGSAQPDLNHDAFKSIEIIIPENIGIQKKIASILSAYDDLIENNNKRIKNLEAMAKIIFDDMMKQAEEKGEVEEVKAEEIIEFIRGVEPGSKNYKSTKGGNDVPFIRVKDLNNGQTETFVDKDLCKGKIATRNDVLVSFDGTIGVVKRGLEGCYSSGIRKLRGKYDYITDEFLCLLFQADYIQNTIKAHAKGTTILHAGGSIKFMKIKLPSQQTIQNFNNQAKPILDLILNLQLQNQNLKQTRDLLIPRLVSGKLDVVEMEVR